jgi:hypothetical protein
MTAANTDRQDTAITLNFNTRDLYPPPMLDRRGGSRANKVR